jgi:RecA/RadA recombinase
MMSDIPFTDQEPTEPLGRTISKVLTGISGFDEISDGGLPRGRLTAIIGAAGAGKTVFALQTIINRLTNLDEPCIFVTFEEPLRHPKQRCVVRVARRCPRRGEIPFH